ncbi:50S ribosomal protein L7/L12-like [Juglans microcarpa x Juglans regia]|uniref:50S ribosomal protein L7/L12-like n=1 Tax=Juglans microcarpa x Juglans regia TaxID=2249226 RepID=UPI001B7E58B8|nr:50S ribosomal protein L7/L12-like [Juglans microcarpa x Juglans regia]
MRGMTEHGGLRELRWSCWWLREARGGGWSCGWRRTARWHCRTRMGETHFGKERERVVMLNRARREVKGLGGARRWGWRLTTAAVATANRQENPFWVSCVGAMRVGFQMGLNKYGPARSGIASADEAKFAEKMAFDIKLEKFDAASKIKIIKEVRTFTDLGLKKAKELVEKAPVVLKKGLTKEEADSIVAKFKDLGATVVL